MAAVAVVLFFSTLVSRPARAGDPVGPSIFPLATRWIATLPAPPSAWPAYDETQAYVPLRSGQLAAVSLADGSSRWTVPASTSLTPAAGGGLVFVATGPRIVAIDAAGGRTRWEATLEAPVSAPLVWDAGWLIAGAGDGRVRALRADDGHELWVQKLDHPLQGPAAIAGDRLYLPLSDGRLASLNLLTGEPVWIQQLGGNLTRLLPLDERLFAGSTDNFFYCVSLRDGSINWRWRTGADVIGPPQVDEERVYFVSLDNVLRALDRNTGVQRWTVPLPIRPSTGVRRIGPVLLVSGLRPQLHVYHAKDGTTAGSLTAEAELGAPPHYFEAPEIGPLLVLLTTPVTGEARLLAYSRGFDPPLVPLDRLPGVMVDVVPVMPRDYLPGTVLPMEPPPVTPAAAWYDHRSRGSTS